MKSHLVIFSVIALITGSILSAITTPKPIETSYVSTPTTQSSKSQNIVPPKNEKKPLQLQPQKPSESVNKDRQLSDNSKTPTPRELYHYNNNRYHRRNRYNRRRRYRGRGRGRYKSFRNYRRRVKRRGPRPLTKWDKQRMLNQKKKANKDMRENGCILIAEFRHFFYNLLSRSSEFTIQFFSNCANIPEITYRVFYKNHMFINWYNHPNEIFLNLFNSVYRLEFRKPKYVNEFDITKAMKYQEMQFFGNKKNPKPLDLNFDNQILLDKQHKFAFEPKNIQKLAEIRRPMPCFVRREMVKGWKKIIKKRMIIKAQKKKLLEMMAKMMSKNQKGRQLSLMDDVPGMKSIVNKKLFRTADEVHQRMPKVKSVKNNIRLVKKKGLSLTRSLKLVNTKRNIERYLKSKEKTKPSKTKKKKPKKKKKKLSKAQIARKKAQEKLKKFKKMVKKVSKMKYKMNRANLLKKMKKKLIKGYYLICASP